MLKPIYFIQQLFNFKSNTLSLKDTKHTILCSCCSNSHILFLQMHPTNFLSQAVCYSFKSAGSTKNSSSVRGVQQHMLSKMQVSTQPAEEKRKSIQTWKSWYSNSFSWEHQTKTPGFPYTLSTPCSLFKAGQ